MGSQFEMHKALILTEPSRDDQAPDAQAIPQSNNIPIPTTRVERVDDEPSHGEVPGTEAYDMRTADAAPDEFEVIPESPKLLDRSQLDTEQSETSSVPKTVVEKVGSETQQQSQETDAAPDAVVEAPESSKGTCGLEALSYFRERLTESGSPTSIDSRFPSLGLESPKRTFRATSPQDVASIEQEMGEVETSMDIEDDDDNNAEEAFGDDFDDFEQGDEADDFGDFDGQANEPSSNAHPQKSTSSLDRAAHERDLAPQLVSFPVDLTSNN